MLSVRFEVGVSLLLAPVGADKRGPKAPFPLVENARIQPVTCKRVPAGAPAGAGSYWKHCSYVTYTFCPLLSPNILFQWNLYLSGPILSRHLLLNGHQLESLNSLLTFTVKSAISGHFEGILLLKVQLRLIHWLTRCCVMNSLWFSLCVTKGLIISLTIIAQRISTCFERTPCIKWTLMKVLRVSAQYRCHCSLYCSK